MKSLNEQERAVQKITPNLWFDHNAEEAVSFYTSVFPSSSVSKTEYYPATSEEGLADFQADLAGKALQIDFTLAGHDFIAINADGTFRPSSANSFLVNFDPSTDSDAEQHIDEVWDKLIDGGEVLMKLNEYPHSKRYGWIKDKYGFGWQLMLTDPSGEPRPSIIPDLLFGAEVQNKAEEAMQYYVSVFGEGSKLNVLARYDRDRPPVTKDAVMFGEFLIGGVWFAAMDSAVEQPESFNEAVSYTIYCKDQNEIDHFWSKLSNDPQFEQCGWCKDKFGVSWQIMPENIAELMKKPGAFKTMMSQKKIVIDQYTA